MVNLKKYAKGSKSKKGNGVITPWFRGAFVQVWRPEELKNAQPNADGRDNKQYSITMLFDENKVSLELMKAAAKAAIKEKWGDKPPKKMNSPFRDGDEVDWDGFEGMTFVRASTYAQYGRPQVIDQQNQHVEEPMTSDEDPAYSGAYFRAKVSASAYDSNGNKGVKFYLDSIQVLADGDRFGGGRVDATEEFDAVEGDEIDWSDATNDDLDDML